MAAFSIGLTFNGMMLMLNRALLQPPVALDADARRARRDLVLNAALYVVLYRVGRGGSRSRSRWPTSRASLLLFVALRRRVGRIDLSETTRSFLLVCLASAALARVAFGVWWVLDEALGRSFVAQLVSLGAALTAGSGVYLVACRALGVREIATLLSLRDRFRRD